MTDRPCPACGSRAATPITHVDLVTPDGHPLQGGYTVVSCDDCGTGFADVVPPIDWYKKFYGSNAKYATEKPNDWAIQRMRSTADRVVARLRLEKNERVIDIGSGNGLLVEHLRWRGFDAIGVDPSGANGALVGSLSRMPEDQGKFDAVLLVGVLEHVWDVEGAMETVASLLKPDGRVYLEVPDAEAYAVAYLGPFEDFNTEHINHFSDTSLHLLGQRHGFASDTRYEWLPFAPGRDARCIVHVWCQSLLRESLVEYASRSVNDLSGLDSRFAELHERFNLWGAGECAYRFLALPSLRERTCELIVDGDRSRQGVALGGRIVGGPGLLVLNDYPIVVASVTRAESILKGAQILGVADRLVNT